MCEGNYDGILKIINHVVIIQIHPGWHHFLTSQPEEKSWLTCSTVAARTEPGFIWEVFQDCFVTEFLGSAGHSSSSCLMMALDSDKTPHTQFLRRE